MRRLLIYARDGVVPPTAELDLAALLPHGYCNLGPMLASISFWVHTPHVRVDPDEPYGGWGLDLRWLDPVDRVRTLPGTPIGITDADACFSSPLVQVNRKSGTSLLVAALSGSDVGSALVSYRIVLLPSAGSDLIWLP